MVEKETTVMESIEQQARHFYEILTGNSNSPVTESADELLLFLNRITDICHTHVEITSHIHAISDIIRGLESNPNETLKKTDVQDRLREFLRRLFRSRINK
jgi:hypothetical protein